MAFPVALYADFGVTPRNLLQYHFFERTLTMDFKLERPIFIEENFVIPLFDLELEKELLNVSDHLDVV